MVTFEIKKDDDNARIICEALSVFRTAECYKNISGFYLDGCSFFAGYCTKKVFVDAIADTSFKAEASDFSRFALDVEAHLASLGFDVIVSVEYDAANYCGAKLDV